MGSASDYDYAEDNFRDLLQQLPHTQKKRVFFPHDYVKRRLCIAPQMSCSTMPNSCFLGMFADVIYGDKPVGAYAWAFFNDGANKHTPIITYHQIDDTNQSIRVKFYYYSAIYFCAKKGEEISEERENKRIQ